MNEAQTYKPKEIRCEVCHAKQWIKIDETHFRCGNCGEEITMIKIKNEVEGEGK